MHAMVLEMCRLHAGRSDSNDGNSMFYMYRLGRVECCNAGTAVMAGVESGRYRMDTKYDLHVCNPHIVEETRYPGTAAREYGHSAKFSLFSTCSLKLIHRTKVICTR
jgi:hypothetical protein